MRNFIFYSSILLMVQILVLSTTLAEEFKIGVTLPLTGAFAEYGEAIKNGIELAVEDAASSSLVKFIYEDDSYDPMKGITAFKKLRVIDKVNLIFAWGIEPVRAISPLAERLKFPTIVGSLDAEVSRGKKYVIGAFSPYKSYSCDLVKVLSEDGAKKLGYIKSEVSLFNGLLDGIASCLGSDQTLKEAFYFTTEEQDFRSIIVQLKKKKFDALGVYLTTPQLFSFFKQAKELKFNTKFFGSTLFYNRDLVEKNSNLLKKSYLTHNIASDEFYKRYYGRFKNDTHLPYAAHAHEIAKLLLNVFNKSQPTNADKIISMLSEKFPWRASVAGKYRVESYPEGGSYYAFPPGVFKINENLGFELVNR